MIRVYHAVLVCLCAFAVGIRSAMEGVISEEGGGEQGKGFVPLLVTTVHRNYYGGIIVNRSKYCW